MFKRELYLSRIRPFYDNEQIKILMGVRRSGKTELLKMIIGELSASKGPESIAYMVRFLKPSYTMNWLPAAGR